MAISSTDLTKLRTKNHLVIPHLNALPECVIATCRVNAPGGITYPTDDIPVDNISLSGGLSTWTDVPSGALVWVGSSDGDYDVHVSSVHKASYFGGTDWKLQVSGFSEGDPGVARYEHVAISDNDYVTIIAAFPMWGHLSRVASGNILKFFDELYTDQTAKPNPVANIGVWLRVPVAGSETDEIVLSAADSIAWSPQSLSNCFWYIHRLSDFQQTGYTVTAGSMTSSFTVTVTLDPGVYLVRARVIDTDSNYEDAYKFIWAVDGDTVEDLTGWQIVRGERDETGRRMTVRMYGDVAESVVFPGAAFLYTEEAYFSGDTLSDGVLVNTFVGYFDVEKGVVQVDGTRYVEFDLLGPGHVLKRVPAVDQYLVAKAAPSEWTHILRGDMSYVDGWVWYILALHAPNVLRCFDLDPSGLTGLQDKKITFTESNILGQLREMCPYRVRVGFRSDGTLVVREWPLLMTDAERDALDEWMAWTEVDLREALEIPWRYPLKVGMVQAGGNAYNPSTNTSSFYLSLAPGSAQAQATQRKVTVDQMLVTDGGGQTENDRVSGHLFAAMNSPTDTLTLHAMGNTDVAEPCDMVWHRVTVGAAYDPRGRGLNVRVLPVRVSERWEQKGRAVLKRLDVEVQVETKGVPGIEEEIDAPA